MQTCLTCDKMAKNKFCSMKCFGASYENKKVTKMCKKCGKKFKRVASDKRLYCSYFCSGSSRRNRIIKTCKFCKKEFETFPCRIKKSYCSRECYGSAKITIISNNNKKCISCGRNKNINKFSQENSSWCKHCVNAASIKSQISPKGRYKYAINQARRRNIDFKISMIEYVKLVSLPCHYCEDKISEKGTGLDRKSNLKGYTVDNCVTCCPRCNWIKGWSLTYNEMIWLGQHLKNLDRLNLK